MSSIRVLFATLACLLIGLASGEDLMAVATKSTEKVDAAVATTKLTPTPSEDSKSKTEKRDSSDQTGGIFIGPTPKDSPFRPLYPSSGFYEAATAETQTAIFGPTTIRYTAAEAAPQTYFERPDNGPSALRYVGPKYAQQGAPPSAPSPTHRFSFAVPPQVALYQRPAAIKSSNSPPHPQPHTQAPPHPPQIFNYGEVEQAEPATASGATYERAGPQLSHKQQQQQSPKYQQQQRIQYIIAIPLSYMRQLQQQQQQQQLFLAPPTSTASSTTTTTSSAAPPPSPSAPALRHPAVQLLGPLGRPYYQSDAASAPAPPAAPPHQQYLQIPTSILLAAAQQLQQHHQQQHLQAIYAKPQPPAASYQPTQLIFQPLASHVQHPQQQQQPQLQLQRIFLQQPQTQSPTIYAEQPAPSSLYAYPVQQQQRLKQPPQHKFLAAAPTAPTTSTTSSTTATAVATSAATGAATTAEGAASATAARQHHLPLVHYNPIYVQAPAAIEQQKQQQHQFAILPRFGNNNPGRVGTGEAVAPLQVVALSPGNPSPPIHHYHHYQALPLYHHHHPLAHSRNPAYVSGEEGPSKASGSSQYLAGPTPAPPGPVPVPVSVPLAVHGSGMTAASPAIIPYFSHPGAVHYGTHLYHPGAGTGLTAGGGAGVATAAASAAATHAISNAKQQQQSQAATSGGHLPGGSNNIVKYP